MWFVKVFIIVLVMSRSAWSIEKNEPLSPYNALVEYTDSYIGCLDVNEELNIRLANCLIERNKDLANAGTLKQHELVLKTIYRLIDKDEQAHESQKLPLETLDRILVIKEQTESVTSTFTLFGYQA